MIAERAFNRKIKSFLKENPNSTASTLINQVLQQESSNNFYAVFDDFSYRLGIGIIAINIVNKNYKTLGYIPCLKYYSTW